MKRFLLFLFFSSTLAAGQWDLDLILQENSPSSVSPFVISSTYLNIASAPFKNVVLSDGLKYRQQDLVLTYTHPFNSCCGLIFGSGWIGSHIEMPQNPSFQEDTFNYINCSVAGYTRSFKDWTWIASLTAYIDLDDFSFIDYALYQGLLWGKYELCPSLELDFGFIVELGLKKERIWPIMGFIYYPFNNCRLSVLYPFDLSLSYQWKKLVAGAAIRLLGNRHRVSQNEAEPQAIFEYATAGGELDLLYLPADWIVLKGFAGRTFGSDLKISDRNDDQSVHYKFKSSFYAGATLLLHY